MSITLDGTLTDWSPSDRLESSGNGVDGYALYGRFEDGGFVLALQSPVVIGADTTFWLNTDADTTTGHQIWGFAGGAELNINFGSDGIPRLYSGAEGQTLVGEIEYVLGAGGTILEMRLPQALIGLAVTSLSVYADVNNSVFLPPNYAAGGYTITQPPASSFDGLLTEWTADQRLDTQSTQIEGYALYGAIEPDKFVFAVQSGQPIAAGTVFWLNVDGNTTTGHQIFGWAGGAEFNVFVGTDGIARLYSGGPGETLVADVDFAIAADGKSMEFSVVKSVLGASVQGVTVLAAINDSVFLPPNFGTGGYALVAPPASTFDGLLTEWTPEQRLEAAGTGVDGYELYGRVDPTDFVVALKAPVAIGASTTFWINTDGNAATGHLIWGWAGGADFNVNIGVDGIARLYSGAAGETFVAEIDHAFGPGNTTIELSIPKALLGVNVQAISVLTDVNDSVFLPNNYGFGGYPIEVPPVSAFDGLLTEWTSSQRIETPTTMVEGYELYGTVANDAYVVALKSAVVIGANTTFWLNTDGQTSTGYLIWDWAMGAEFNVNIGADGKARLYTGAAGETLVSELDYALSPDGLSLELAIPKALIGNISKLHLMADVNDTVHLPADYTQPAYTITDPASVPPVAASGYKVAIVYSQTTAGAYWSEMAYAQLVMAAQSQAMSAGIPFDLIGESDLTDLAKLSQYSALVFPSFRNAPANYADIAATLNQLVYDYDIPIITAGDFMTNAANGDGLSGNPYERMQTLLGLSRTGGDSGVEVNLITTQPHDVTAGYTDGTIRTYTNAATSYFTPLVAGSATVIAQQVINGVSHDAVISTTTGGRNVHFATEAMLADNNLLGQALDWSTTDVAGPKISLSMSRDNAIVAARNDMDQSQETYDVDGGIYNAMMPILDQWKAQYNFVGSYYINVGLYGPDQETNWFLSSPYYQQLLAMGNEIGSHSYSHPSDTNLLLPDVVTQEILDQRIAAYANLLSNPAVCFCPYCMREDADQAVIDALAQMSVADINATLQAALVAPDPMALDPVSKAIVEASFRFQFETSRHVIENNLGIVVTGAAVPGMPENLETARQIIQYYDYLSGGASMIGAGYPGAFGYLTPDDIGKVYLAPNMSFDFTLLGWLGLTAEQAAAKWIAEFNDLTINADLPIIVWPWHDYGITGWDIDGTGTSPYTLAMFTSFLDAAHAAGSEFVTLADLAARIATFEQTDLKYAVNGNTITVTATPQHGTLGAFAIDLNDLGGQTIQAVTNWYAYDANSVFLDADGGAFEIVLGAAQADVTRITSLGARMQLLNLVGDGTNLSFTIYGEGLVTVDLKMPAGTDFTVTGAEVLSKVNDIWTLKLGTLGTHSVTITQTEINLAPTDITINGLVAAPELLLDRIKIADLVVIDPNTLPAFLNNVVSVSDERFEIDPTDGALYRKAGVSFDFETEPQITLTLTATDGALSYQKQITVAVSNVNEAPSGAVTISGPAVENETLTADIATLADPDGLGPISLQWQRDTGTGFVDIAGATAASYTLTNSDALAQVRVVASYTDAGGTLETVASAATTPVVDVNRAPTGAVTITGTPTENQTLTAVTTTLADADGLGPLSYQWQRDTGTGFADIPGATASTYTLTYADSPAQFRVVASYTDGGGAVETIASSAIGPVANVNRLPTGAVTISGSAVENQTLTAVTTTLADLDGLGSLSYQWQRDTGTGFVNITGATASTYKLVAADALATIRVTVKYTDGGGVAEAITSTPTPRVTDVVPAVALPALTEDMTRIITAASLAPAFAGTAFTIVGLTASTGTLAALADGTWLYVPALNDDTGVTFSYSVQTATDTKLASATLDLVGMTDILGTSAANTLAGRANADQYHGGAGNDVIRGGAGNDIMFGDAGNDTIYGEDGNDIFVATIGDGNDSYIGGTGTDTLDLSRLSAAATVNLATGTATSTQSGTDTLNTIEDVIGGSGNDIITGSSVANKIWGGAGNDRIEGGGGKDILTGGTGNDTFVFRSVTDSLPGTATRDVITDFVKGQDKIDLSLIDANSIASGNQAFVFVATAGAPFTAVRGQLTFYFEDLAGTANDKTIIVGDINGDRGADFSIELSGLIQLTATDFIL